MSLFASYNPSQVYIQHNEYPCCYYTDKTTISHLCYPADAIDIGTRINDTVKL